MIIKYKFCFHNYCFLVLLEILASENKRFRFDNLYYWIYRVKG